MTRPEDRQTLVAEISEARGMVHSTEWHGQFGSSKEMSRLMLRKGKRRCPP